MANRFLKPSVRMQITFEGANDVTVEIEGSVSEVGGGTIVQPFILGPEPVPLSAFSQFTKTGGQTFPQWVKAQVVARLQAEGHTVTEE